MKFWILILILIVGVSLSDLLAESDFIIDPETSRAIPNFAGKITMLKGKAEKITPDLETHEISQGSKLQEKDIVKVREAFLILSDSMIQYMKSYTKDDAQEKGYKLFYCGMEKKSWVQIEEEVGNPYVSANIAFCGARDDY